MTTDPDLPPPPGPSRRTVVIGAAAAAGIATVAGLWFEGFGDASRRRRVEPTPEGVPLKALDPSDRRPLEAIVDRLLPSGGKDSPGARDVNAVGYFDALFQTDEINDNAKALILWGIRQLGHRANAKHGTTDFAGLPIGMQEALIRTMEKDNDGVRWLRVTLEFVLECFFGDPVHGGNTNEIGWRWARHRPGTPRPTQPGWRMKEQP